MSERLPEYQGRTKEQQDSNETVAAWSVILFLSTVVLCAVFYYIKKMMIQ